MDTEEYGIAKQGEDLQNQLLHTTKKQLICSRFIAILLLAIVLILGGTVATTMPKVNTVLVNLEKITDDVKNHDLGQTVEKVNEFDLEAFNKAIEDLGKILQGISKWFS